LEILNGLNEAAISTNDTVTIEVLDETGLPKNANIPSYGYLRGEIQRLDSNVKALAGLGDNFATVRNPDGTYSQVFKTQTLKDPPTLANLPVPSTFAVRDNWFFESFLSPLLYINVNVTGKIPDSADRITVKRIIANTDTDVKKSYFDANLKGRNDMSYDQFVKALSDNGIEYFVDEDILQLPLRTIRFVGNFGVISYYDDTVTVTNQNANAAQNVTQGNTANSFQEIRRNYKLDTLNYTDTLSNVKNGRTLDIGDRIATPDGTLYQVTAVNKDQASIQAKRLSGYEPIKLGANTISIASTDFGPRYVQVNIGHDERQGIFFKTIDDNFNIVGSTWSTGITFWSSELQTKNSNGQVVTLEQYYLSDVSDMGKIFLGMAKEKKIPAVQGLKPDSPLVVSENFKVVQINKQVTDSTSVTVISDKLKLKSTLKSEIDSIDNSINNVKLQLNAGLATSDQTTVNITSTSSSTLESTINPILGANLTPAASRLTKNPIGVNTDSLKANLNSLIDERTKKVSLYSSIVDEVNTLSQDVPQLTADPKYRVRGFWAIPAPKTTPTTGDQAVIQFSVRYRYLSDSGAAQPSEQIEYVDTDNVKKVGAFSNWTEYKTDIRKKVYDPTTGFYVWADEVTADSNVQNINQLDLAITKGEKLEIQIASISEAGWPDNPQVSDYSASVTVSFPDNLSVSGTSNLIKTNNEDSAVVKMQTNLNAQGLPIHLSEQFTSSDKTYLHTTNSIASGFFTSTGAVISLFDKINDLQNQIAALQAGISKAKGVLQVYIVDASGNRIKVSRGSTIKLNAGFYTDFFSAPLTNDAGKVASVIYNIQLSNAEASILELSSIIPGGLDVQAPSAIANNIYPPNYSSNLRYGDIPISITGLAVTDIQDSQAIRQAAPYASANAYSQFIYPRFQSVGYNQILVQNPVAPSVVALNSYFSSTYNSGYAYTGSSTSAKNFGVSGVYPQNGTIFTPYDPTTPGNVPQSVQGATAANIWNGYFGGGGSAGVPDGGGNITEFCIDKRHPVLLTAGSSSSYNSYADLVKPYIDPTTQVSYAPFRHTQTFWGDSSLNVYWVQQAYRPVVLTFPATYNGASALEDNMYPDKLGFSSGDEYLVGKFSCGAYLFLAPSSGANLQVSGNTALSTKQIATGETNAVNIPMIFQFRAVDKSGFIGGWRKAGTLTNITYTKKIGIDIQVYNEQGFSFDVQVTGAYQNNTLVAPNFVGGRNLLYAV
jgi:hypothetical protein